MTQETINSRFEVDGIVYVHPDYRETFQERADAFCNARPMMEIINDFEIFDVFGMSVTPERSWSWCGSPTTKGLMDD